MDICKHNDKDVLLNEIKRICDTKYIGDDYLYSFNNDNLVIVKKSDTTKLMSIVKVIDENFAAYKVNNIIVVSVYCCKSLIEIKNYSFSEHWYKNSNFYKTFYPAFYLATPLMDGEQKLWHQNGRIEKIYYIHEGFKNGLQKSFYYDGRLSEVTNRLKGIMNGLYEKYRINGQLKCRTNYTNGCIDGIYEFYYDSGYICERSNWKNGVMYGLYEKFLDNSGILLERKYY